MPLSSEETSAADSGSSNAAPGLEELHARDDAKGEAKGSATPWVISTYFAEGLPFSIVHQVSTQLFTFLGASLEGVGLTALYGLAWNLKFAWSPLVDRYGTARRWLVAAELVLAALVAAIAWPAERGDLRMISVGFALVAIAAATHDIAVDGFYLRALGKSDQAAFVGLRVAAYRIALFVGNGFLVVLAGSTSWRWCFLVAGAMLAVLAVNHWLFLPKELPREQLVERPRFTDAFASFLKKPKIAVVLPFIVLFKAGDALMFAMSTPFVKSLGFQIAGSGYLSGAGTIASITGTIVGGALIARRGLSKMLFPIAAIQSAAIPLYVAAAAVEPSTPWIVGVVVLEQFAGGFGNAALAVFLMRRSAGAYRASHYAMGTALMSLAMTGAGSASGYLAKMLGFTMFFALAFAASIPGVLLARVVPTEEQEEAPDKEALAKVFD